MQMSDGLAGGRKGAILGVAPLAATFAALLTAFAVTSFTNEVLFRWWRVLAHRGADWPATENRFPPFAVADRYDAYLLASTKDALFFAALVTLLWPLRGAVAAIWPSLKRRSLWIGVLGALCIAGVLLFNPFPSGMGRAYQEASVEPFLQHQGMFNRRILMPVLAHDIHLGGVLYGFACALATVGVIGLTVVYLQGRGLALSVVELGSLLTTGLFASTLGLPGYGDIIVLGLTLVALLDFDRRGRAGVVQVACFGLALLAHESAAVLAFGILGVCRFGPRFMAAFAFVLGLYVATWLAAFDFDPAAAVRAQGAGDTPKLFYALNHIPHVLFSAVVAYKLAIVALTAGAFALWRVNRRREALVAALALAGGLGLCGFGTDYSRMISFGTFGLLVALPAALEGLDRRQRLWLALGNLLVPTLYARAQGGFWPYPGLYGFVLTHGLGLHPG